MLTTSPSQADNARGCLRKWAWDWILPRDGQSSPEAETGKEIHAQAQAYTNTGAAPTGEAGAILLSGLPYMPKALVGRSEGEFTLTVSGLAYKGVIDWQGVAGDLPGTPAYLADCPAAMDYKSVKDLQARRMLIGPGAFLNDPQALLYALKMLIQSGSDRVYLRWLYLKREGQKKSKAHDCLLTRGEVVAAFGRVMHPIASKLIQIRTKGDINPLDLDPSPDRCMAYGPKWPCPHISRCNLSAADKLRYSTLEPTGEQDMSLMDELKAMTAGGTTGGINPTPAPQQAAAPSMISGVGQMDEEAALAAQLEAVKIRKANAARVAREREEAEKAAIDAALEREAATNPSDADALAALKVLRVYLRG